MQDLEDNFAATNHIFVSVGFMEIVEMSESCSK